MKNIFFYSPYYSSIALGLCIWCVVYLSSHPPPPQTTVEKVKIIKKYKPITVPQTATALASPAARLDLSVNNNFNTEGFNIYKKIKQLGGKHKLLIQTRKTKVNYDQDMPMSSWLKQIHGPEPKWEPQTFNVFDKWLPKHDYYIGFGTWIGPTLFYAAQQVKHSYGIEGDPSAYGGECSVVSSSSLFTSNELE